MNGATIPDVVAIFGPTATGKTEVAIALAGLLSREGVRPIAVNADSMQVYRGLEILSAAPDRHQQQQLKHKLTGFVDPREEFSVGRYAPLAHREIDAAIDSGMVPIVVGGTGLYLQAAVRELNLKPQVPDQIRRQVELELAERGSEALHADLHDAESSRVHPNDRKRIARITELRRAGLEPHHGSGGLWQGPMRHPTAVFGLDMNREELHDRITIRVDRMIAAGAFDEAGQVQALGLSRTAHAMIGIEAALSGDRERLASDHRKLARRQATWMRKAEPITVIDRSGLQDDEVAETLKRDLVG